ncbi:mannitol-1-phosphate/altronate dehydrogenase [Caulobacter sp. AP07]|uniref:mannitol dehydrogenase family protein n=1 Tax=Caulobacter sp. AP07 TaxID=1144304 RepID=UPI000271DAA6|nr:mannitol dehydrogenase family protein [Caulobacter sp. AP07]EJL20930.1 mannitol-1-phosphate/altronate dehydrogenase [Caulobacter sp. AP07]
MTTETLSRPLRLNAVSFPAAIPGVALPAYDRDKVTVGVVHFGPGAFHRAHQAFYFDQLLAKDPRWGISAVSLKSPGVRDALQPQDGLYTLAQLDAETTFRVVGSILEVLVAPEDPPAVFARLAAPHTRMVTLTVTEKGYCLTGDGKLDTAHPDIVHDLASPREPVSVIGYIVEGLRRRHQAGLPPYAVVACDNLADNGWRLKAATVAFAQAVDPVLAAWIETEARFPRTMVDSITPATDDALRARVEAATGLTDAWPIQREAFTQWVVEDVLGPPSENGGAPDLASVGVTLTDDVRGFERAKLRLLNGVHSTIAYAGLLKGHETVFEAISDADLARLAEDLMVQDIIPTLTAPRGLDLAAYAQAILGRFRNPEIRHLLAQIAWDGSQKLPFRLLGTVADALAAGRPVDRLTLPLAAWMRFVRRRAAEGVAIVDPLADRLVETAAACTGDARADVGQFLKLEPVFSRALAGNPVFVAALEGAYATLA